MTRVTAPKHTCLSISTIVLVPLVKTVILEYRNLEIAGNIKLNLITHHSENNPVILPTLQETHYLHTTHTSCRLPASCTTEEKEGVVADVTASLLICCIHIPKERKWIRTSCS